MPEINVLLADDDGRLLVNDDGSALVAYSLQVPSTVPVFSADDFRDATLALLPTGPVWPKDGDSAQFRVATGLAPTYARMTGRAADLIVDSPVGLLTERLPEWEATLGLPDPCAGASPTLLQRQRSVATAIAARGGQSVPYVRLLLAALGRTGTVIEYAPARVGGLATGAALAGPGWGDAWEVVVDPIPLGMDGQVASNDVVTCVIKRMCPAHTVLITTFSAA